MGQGNGVTRADGTARPPHPRSVPPTPDLVGLLDELARAQETIAAARPGAVASTSADVVLGLLGADAVVIALDDRQHGPQLDSQLDPPAGHLVVRAVCGDDPLQVGARLPVQGTLYGLPRATGRPQLVPDVAELAQGSAAGPTGVQGLGWTGAGSAVGAPLLHEGRPAGVLLATAAVPGRFGAVHLRLLVLLAAVTAARLDLDLERSGSEEARGALADRERLLAAVLNGLDVGLLAQDPLGRGLLTNDAAVRILGLPEEALLAGGWRDLEAFGADGRAWDPEQRPLARTQRSGQPERERLMGVRRPDGEERWLTVTAVPVAGPDGRGRAGTVASFADVTGLVAAQHAAAADQRRVLAARALTGLALWEWDLATDRLTWSDEMFVLVGLEPGAIEPTAQAWYGFVHPEDRVRCREQSREATRRGTGYEDVLRIVRADGAERWLRAWSEVEVGPDGAARRILGASLDVTEQETARRELAVTAARLRDAQELTGLAWWEWDQRAGRLAWSEGHHRLVGLPLGATPTPEQWLAHVHPDDRSAATELEQRARDTGQPYQHVFRVFRWDTGELHYLQSTTAPLYDERDGSVRGLRGASLDVTGRELAARAAARGDEELRLAFDEAPIGMVMTKRHDDGVLRVVRANDAFCRLLGYTHEQLVGQQPALWTRPEEVATSRVRTDRLLDGPVRSHSYEKQLVRSDGSLVDVLVTNSRAEIDGEQLVIAHCLDVTERRQYQDELERLALTDSLTGLANRSLLEDRASRALARLGREGGVVGLLLLDLDRFKLVNDSLGHLAGDALLVEVARRLDAVTREDTTVARLGGDEFVLLVEGAHDAAEVEAVAQRVLAVLREPYELPGGEVVVGTGSVGLALATTAGRTMQDLLREADLALYRAKDSGRDRRALFDDDLRSRAVSRLEAENRVRAALREGTLRIAFQPVVDLAGGPVLSGEALVRVAQPDGPPVLPPGFIEVAEESGLICEVDTWVVDAVCAALAAGGHPSYPEAGVWAVNVSGRSLEQPGYADVVAETLARHGLSGDRLRIEITERTLLDGSGQVREALRRLGQLGCGVGIDDFGTGYSALAYLQRFDLDFLKIDMSFVQRLGASARDDALVAAVVDLAHAHDLVVVAEGVETEEQAALLRGMGCDRAQGWLFGRPAPLP
ncbi:MAG: sensor domain-containing protein [Motilibacteraceae bacterium]